jgi:transketolase
MVALLYRKLFIGDENMADYKRYRDLALKIREHCIRMTNRGRSGHTGSMLSMADLLAVLYEGVMNVDPKNPKMETRDRFILSKGHAGAGVYAVLAEKGFFPKEWLEGYYMDHGKLSGHISHYVPGVECSTGSLGHGLPIACGLALAAKVKGKKHRVFCMVSDGDMNEGSTWEAIFFAKQQKLDNLIVILDANKIQALGQAKDVLDLEPLDKKIASFGWATKRINGHDFAQIEDAFSALPIFSGMPTFIMADTIKCKGIPAMEGTVKSHYWYVADEDLEKTIADLGENS